jgi:hypothetical protein
LAHGCGVGLRKACGFPKALTDGVPKVPKGCSEGFWHLWHLITLERVMNSIRNGLGMREAGIVKEPSRPWNPYFYAIFAQVHNTL